MQYLGFGDKCTINTFIHLSNISGHLVAVILITLYFVKSKLSATIIIS